MRLRRLDLIRYGRFTDFTLDFGERVEGEADLHVVYGLNEAGKSTALAGFLDLLFGIEERSRYGFLHQYAAMEVGAALEYGGGTHEVRRVKQRSGSLRDPSGQPIGDMFLGAPLAGLTREAYRMMFSLDDQTLEDGGNAILDSKGDLGELLFSASAGLAGLSKALSAVGGEADGIFRKKASSTEVAALKRQLSELKTARVAVDVQAGAHATLVAELKTAERNYDDEMAARGELKARLTELGGLMRAAPLVDEHARVGAELSEMTALPRPPAHWATELPALMIDDATLKTKLAGLDERIERLRTVIEGIEVDDRMLRLAEGIERLSGASIRFQGAEADLPKRRVALLESRARLAQYARSITGEETEVDPAALVVGAPTLGSLRELIEKWSGIEAKLASATTEFGVASQALEVAKEERALLDEGRVVLDAARQAAIEATVARTRDLDLSAQARLARSVAEAKARAASRALAALAPWSGTPEALEAFEPPSSRQIQIWRDELAKLDLRAEQHREKRRDLETAAMERAAEIAVAEAAAGSIGDVEAVALRERRDSAWEAHRVALDTSSASPFEGLMRAYDTMTDARLAAADRLAELRGLRRDREVGHAQAERETELLTEIDTEMADLAMRLTAACPSEIDGDRTRPVGERIASIEAWSAKRGTAVAAIIERREAQLEIQEMEAALTREGGELAAILAPFGIAADGLEAVALLRAAEVLLAKDAADRQAREAADKLVRDCVRARESRRKALASAEDDSRAWCDRWAKMLAGSWFADREADRGAVKAIVDALGGLPARIAERDELNHRIEAMESDREVFVTALRALREELGEGLDEEETVAASAALSDRCQAAVRAEASRSEKEAEHAKLADQRTELTAEIAVHAARREELTTFFAVEDLVAVSASLERSARRDRMEEARNELELRIMRETGSQSIASALERLEGLDLAQQSLEHDDCARRLEDVDERLKALFAAKSSAADKLDAIGGDDAVARIEGERRTVVLELEDKAMRFLHLRSGTLLAERALQIYREKHRGSMMGRASEAFRTITRGAYSGLATRPDKEREILIGVPGAGGSKLATDMSKGTRFQLYLALRLAGYEEFASTREPVPFVADDIMETFDEPRSTEVISLFEKMSGLGQVIYFTHHRHICNLAREAVARVKLHELPL